MEILKDTFVYLDGEWHTADVIMPEPGSEDEVLTVVPGTLKLVDLDILPLTPQDRRLMKAEAADFESRNRYH